jgi:hypothetical protein
MTSQLSRDSNQEVDNSAPDIVSMFLEREPERYALHTRYMNEVMVRIANGCFAIGRRPGREVA